MEDKDTRKRAISEISTEDYLWMFTQHTTQGLITSQLNHTDILNLRLVCSAVQSSISTLVNNLVVVRIPYSTAPSASSASPYGHLLNFNGTLPPGYNVQVGGVVQYEQLNAISALMTSNTNPSSCVGATDGAVKLKTLAPLKAMVYSPHSIPASATNLVAIVFNAQHCASILDALPPTITELTIELFNEPCDKLPSTLTELVTSDEFDFPVDNLPSSLKSLITGNYFNQPFSSSLFHLITGHFFNQPSNKLPSRDKNGAYSNLQHVEIKSNLWPYAPIQNCFSAVSFANLPPSLKHLNLPDQFNVPTDLPPTVTHVTSGLLSNLKEKSWKKALAPEFAKPYFKDILLFMEGEYRSGKIICPGRHEIFNAFNLTPLEKVKVVILGQPVINELQSDGLSFSNSKSYKKISPSLKNLFKELETDITGFVTPSHGSLIQWARRGVFLLNQELTTVANVASSHKKWMRFTDAVIELLNKKTKGLVFILFGAFAQRKAKLLDSNRHHFIMATHPSPLCAKTFFGSKVFSRTNEILKSYGKEEIDWKLQ